MPLTENDDIVVGIACGCGAKFRNDAQFFAHVGDCVLLRCRGCLMVLKNDHPFSVGSDDPKTHVCAAIKLVRLARWMKDNV